MTADGWSGHRDASPSRGIYLLANDPILDWLTALATSLRRFEPTAPICLIPFDSRLSRTRRLAENLAIDVFDDSDLLMQLDEFGDRFHPANPVGARLYRKFAVFNGPFDEFLYLDADVVVQTELVGLLRPISDGRVDFLATDTEDAGTVFRTGLSRPARRRDEPLVNAGIFASSKGALDFGRLNDLAGLAEDFKSGEQSALNCLLALSDLRLGVAADYVTGYPGTTFAFRLRDMDAAARASAPLVHWAGEALTPAMSLRAVYVSARCSWRAPIDSLGFLLWRSRIRPLLRRLWHGLKR